MAQNVKSETAKTKNEFADLANARTTPSQPAATGQLLTRTCCDETRPWLTATDYHSMFYRLLSVRARSAVRCWLLTAAVEESPRYGHLVRRRRRLHLRRSLSQHPALRLQGAVGHARMCVGVCLLGTSLTSAGTAAAEMTGKAAFGHGFASQFRPRKYFVIPKASLERLLDDVEQLINFFVIEFQRIVFAENVTATVAVGSRVHFGRC